MGISKKLKFYYCKEIGCNNKICHDNYHYGKGRCNSCANRITSTINGETLKKYYCIDCGKEISYGNKRCLSCAKQNKNNPAWKGGLPRCIDCGKLLSDRRVKRCNRCAAIYKWTDEIFREKTIEGIKNRPSPTIETRIKIGKLSRGRKHSQKTKDKMSKKSKLNWQNKEYREKCLKASFEGRKLSPNKPEKLLIKLLQKILPKTYKFVGDGKLIVGGFIPDFVNKGNNKIIEMFGCYWHKCKECGFGKGRPKDVGRLKEYNKAGYKTLIIWEHELKDIENVKKKILEFNNGNL